MISQRSILCKLGGHVNSNPIIISSYPLANLTDGESSELLSVCLPIGAKEGEFYIKKLGKYKILSYVFKVQNQNHRDDIFSLSILLDKKSNPEIYQPILKKIINGLKEAEILTEQFLIDYQEDIYNSINEEKNLVIDDITINLHEIFAKIKKKTQSDKPKLKGSFF